MPGVQLHPSPTKTGSSRRAGSRPENPMTGPRGEGACLTVLSVPKLNTASVVAGACCPVPAEAIIVPELEAIHGVYEAQADWQTAEVRVRHTPDVAAEDLARALSELDYPPESWNTEAAEGVTKN